MEEYKFNDLKKGDLVKGVIVSIADDKTAYVDVKSFTEGTIHLDHFTTDKTITSFYDVLKVGDEFEFTVTAVKEESILLSRLNQVKEADIAEVKAAMDADKSIDVLVETKTEKGFVCKYNGVRLFMPKSQSRDAEVGKTITVKILSCEIEGSRGNIIVSRKEIVDMEYNLNKQKEYELINEGDVLKGTVVKIDKFGALVHFNYVTGLLKTNQVAHEFIDITKALTIGQEIEVKVLAKHDGKVDLSRKAVIPSPFSLYIKNHKVSDTVKGKLTNKLQFGLLIELEAGVKALLHKNEFSHNPNDNFANCVVIGDEIEASIITIDEANEKIGLSRKPLLDNPWARVEGNVGDTVNVKISSVTEKGLNVEAYGVDGFIPASETGVPFGKIKDEFAAGDTLDAIVTELKPREWKLKLSIKKLVDAKERAEYEKHNVNEEVSTNLGDQIKALK